MFTQGQLYHRRSEIHALYGGQQQGGISTPAKHKIILLFTGESGEQYGYSDGWTDEGIYLYTGEGQKGDMSFRAGNLAIRDHLSNGEDLHLFEYVKTGYVRYIGQMVCTGYQWRQSKDEDKKLRQAIVFELLPVDEIKPSAIYDEPIAEPEVIDQPLAMLRQRALDSSTEGATPTERKTLFRKRSTAIRAYALKRSNGICAGCDQPAPFSTPKGAPFLEVHHIDRLSDEGIDHPNAVIAVCPNCHRRAHHSSDAKAFNAHLKAKAAEQEQRVQSER